MYATSSRAWAAMFVRRFWKQLSFILKLLRVLLAPARVDEQFQQDRTTEMGSLRATERVVFALRE